MLRVAARCMAVSNVPSTRREFDGESDPQAPRWAGERRPATPVATDDIRPRRSAPLERAAIGFGETEPVDPWSTEQIEGLGRQAWVVEDRDTIVGTSADLTWQLTLPGGTTTPVGAVIAVTTRASHRRRGVLTALMGAQLGAMTAGASLQPCSPPRRARSTVASASASPPRSIGSGANGSARARPCSAGTHRPGRGVGIPRRDRGFSTARQGQRPGTLSRPELWWDHLVLGERRSFEGGGPQFVSLHRRRRFGRRLCALAARG